MITTRKGRYFYKLPHKKLLFNPLMLRVNQNVYYNTTTHKGRYIYKLLHKEIKFNPLILRVNI